MTIIAHQKQIEELRESFRQKVSEAESWSEKVTDHVYYVRQCISQDLFLVGIMTAYVCVCVCVGDCVQLFENVRLYASAVTNVCYNR